MKIINPEYSVERIVERMKEAAARSATAVPDWCSSGDGLGPSEQLKASADFPEFEGALGIRRLTLQPSFQPHEDDQYHVNDLLKYHDRNFIQNAYQAVLKRAPDTAGYNGFLESLRSGRLNKIDILARLRFSAEGRAKKVQIDGLQLPAAIRMAYRVPLLGYLLNLGVGIVRLPAMIRSQRQFQAQVLAQQEMVVEHANHIGLSLQAHAREVKQLLTSHSESVDRLGGQVRREIKELRVERATSYEVFLNRIAELTNYLEEHLNDLALQQQKVEDHLDRNISRHQKELTLMKTEFEQGQARLSERIELLSGNVDLLGQRATSEVGVALEKQQQLRSEVVLQSQRLARLLEEVGKRLPAPLDQDQLQSIAEEERHLLDSFYADFDEQFRGSREEIKERLKVYLPFIKNSSVGRAAMRILDVGCGRGEWLEVLREEGFHAVGVDSNRTLVAQCRELGLEIVEDDLMNYVDSLPDASLDGVTGFHIVEHLPLETLVEFLNETLRVLKPGGIVIFETPNPRNVLVGSCNFYFDPTHRNPLPSEVMKFLVESRGFVQVEVLPLNPSNEAPVEGDSELVNRFNDYFYGPMDYAIVAWKPEG